MSEEEIERRRQVVFDQLISEGLASGEPIEITDESWAEKREVLRGRFRDGPER